MDLGDVLLPYQKKWLEDRAQVKVVEKSRRIGLTWAQALDDVLKAATSGRDGMDVLYISFNQDMTREYIDTCADWAKKLQVVAGQINEETHYVLKKFGVDVPGLLQNVKLQVKDMDGTRYLPSPTALPTCAASRGASSLTKRPLWMICRSF